MMGRQTALDQGGKDADIPGVVPEHSVGVLHPRVSGEAALFVADTDADPASPDTPRFQHSVQRDGTHQAGRPEESMLGRTNHGKAQAGRQLVTGGSPSGLPGRRGGRNELSRGPGPDEELGVRECPLRVEQVEELRT